MYETGVRACIAAGSLGVGIWVIQRKCEAVSVLWLQNRFLLFPKCPAAACHWLNVNKVFSLPFSTGPCARITLCPTVEFKSQSMFHETWQMLCGKGVLLLNKFGAPCILYPHWKFITEISEKAWMKKPVPTLISHQSLFGNSQWNTCGGNFWKHCISQKQLLAL